MPRKIFETARLTGRQIEPADLEEMLVVYGDLDAMKWVGDGTVLSRDDAVRWLGVTANNYATRGYGLSAIIERATGTLIGFIGVGHPGNQPEAEIKYTLKRAWWGQGLATEAVTAMLAYVHRERGLNHVIATTAPENKASHRVLLKSGMVQGELRKNEDGSLTQVFDWWSPAPITESPA